MSRKNKEKQKQKIRQKAREKELKRKEKAKKRQEQDKAYRIGQIRKRQQALAFIRQYEYMKPTFDKSSFQTSPPSGDTTQSHSEDPVLDRQVPSAGNKEAASEGFNTNAWKIEDEKSEETPTKQPQTSSEGFNTNAWNVDND